MVNGQRTGLFVAFEGPEGSGKSTQARLLADRLRAGGLDVDLTREPGGTDLGERLREILLLQRKLQDHEPRVQALLMSAARAQHVAERIRPALTQRRVVVCDRFAASTYAYQGGGFGLPAAELESLVAIATAGVVPDLYVLVDIDVRAGLQRSLTQRHEDWEKAGGINWTRIEFHERVRRAYRDLAGAHPEDWLLVDGAASIEEIAAAIWPRVQDLTRGRDLRPAEQATQPRLPLRAT